MVLNKQPKNIPKRITILIEDSKMVKSKHDIIKIKTNTSVLSKQLESNPSITDQDSKMVIKYN